MLSRSSLNYFQVVPLPPPLIIGVEVGQQVPALHPKQADLPDAGGFDTLAENMKNASTACRVQALHVV
ncbi:uncharacterized protein Dvar_29640 [Desulfosarcina variabilis str. Montpellier]